MPIYIPNAGELSLLEKMLIESGEDANLRLYRNNLTPEASTVAGDFQEANFTNYSAKLLERSKWNVPVTINGEARAIYSEEQNWSVGSTGNTIYGYYVTGKVSGTILWAEKFSRSRALDPGDELTITPIFNFRTQITCS